MALRVLFLGGTGIISSACAAPAVERGADLTVVTRGGTSAKRPLPEGVRTLTADVREPAALREALGGEEFDAVVDFVAFTPDHVRADVETFTGRTGQYVFVSSASAYQKPVAHLPITESTPLHNPWWQYSRDKIACEELLTAAYREQGFPATVVRPSHTYDRTSLPVDGGWTVVDRMRRGAEIVVPGDGTSLWTLTHQADFAHAFVGLLGHPSAIGDSFHITSDEWLAWNEIYETVAAAAGVSELKLVHVPSDAIAAADPDWGAGMLGDKAHSMIFDNAKVKRLVPDYVASIPFVQGAREILSWYDANPARQQVDAAMNATMDDLVQRYRVAAS